MKSPAILQLGFRPFFFGAALFSLLAILIWQGIYVWQWPVVFVPGLSPLSWHAHEMIFGYGMAVVAGFLLTASRNWTGVQTLQGMPLLILCGLWLTARILPFIPSVSLAALALVNSAFLLGVFGSVAYPILRVKQWKQNSILFKLLLLAASDALFHLGVIGILPQGTHWGLYSGVYLLLALMFTIGRRVFPFFIEKGLLPEKVALKNSKWLDQVSLWLFLGFSILDVFFQYPFVVAVLSILLFGAHLLRLSGWHHPGIWKRPMLWVLFLSYSWLLMGFLLKAASIWFGLSPFLALHAFAVGGVGMGTLGMMSRVALGHTGRNIYDHSQLIIWAFALLGLSGIFRVFGPMLPVGSNIWIALAQTSWIAAFSLFLVIYLPILWTPRVDGQPG